jgi:2-oxoglutarate ferredoxin oxidoreductase subunit alpha
MTDQFLADSHFSIGELDIAEIKTKKYLADPLKVDDYKRYSLNESGISPRLCPGQSAHLVCADSDEHDELGHITEDLSGTAIVMMEKRANKFRSIKKEIKKPEEKGMDDSKLIFVGWGSSRNSILEAIEKLEKDDFRAGMIHFTELWPLPDYEFPSEKELISVESNINGQLARLLRSEYGLNFKGSINRYDGLPITGEYIRRRFNEKYR